MDDRPADATGAVAGVVLAAGTGRRMGQPKAMLSLDGQPLVLRATEALRDGGCHPVGVVVGADGDRVAEVVSDRAQVVVNETWATGMASSVRAALHWVADVTPSPQALVVLPVDTPGIGVPVVQRMLERWASQTPAHRPAALVATYGGHRRNPVLLPADVWESVAARVRGDLGARIWLQDNPERIVEVECSDLGVPTDLDTPADLAAWRSTADPVPAEPTTGEAHGA